MSREFKLWILGTVIHLLFSFLLFYGGRYLNPENHFSFLETWAIVMMIFSIFYGINIYKEDEEIYID
jgi:hypothetical protein